MEIRDVRNGEWHWVYNAVLECSHISVYDKAVYSALSSFSGFQKINPSIKQISERCSVSERQVIDSLQTLDVIGYIQISKEAGLNNVYYLIKTKGCAACTSAQRAGVPMHSVHTTHAQRAYSKYIDKDIKNTSEVETSQEEEFSTEPVDDNGFPLPVKQKKDTSYRKVFALWGRHYPLNWNVNTTEIQAAKNIIAEGKLEKAFGFLKLYEKYKNERGCPKIIKPSDLDRKWDDFKWFGERL